MRCPSACGTLACTLLVLTASSALAQVPARYKPVITKGLDWLARTQHRDGHWEGTGGQQPIAMTALAGMALLCEGSTSSQGKYAGNIKRAREFLVSQARPSGLICNPNDMTLAARYMYGHGFAVLFLASVYGEETDVADRRKLEDILTRAAKFTRDAQTSRGGWGYVTARDGNDFDEGSVTVTQLQGLRAARNAGIKVPPETIREAVKYLEQSTNPQGGVIYSLQRGAAFGGAARPALTAAAICCGFSAGEYESPLVKKWFKFCKDSIPLLGGGRMGHDEYTHYYYAQAMYALGNDGWAKLFPEDKGSDRMTWKKYREATFDTLVRSQSEDGSWDGHNWTARYGKVYVTAVYLTILQLDNNTLPIYQR
jgi:squalene cyclase